MSDIKEVKVLAQWTSVQKKEFRLVKQIAYRGRNIFVLEILEKDATGDAKWDMKARWLEEPGPVEPWDEIRVILSHAIETLVGQKSPPITPDNF